MIIVPVQNYPDYFIALTISGTVYVLRFTYNGREDCWYFSIYTGGNALLESVKIVSNLPLIHRYANPLLPAGDFLALDVLNVGDPGRNDLGSLVPFIYVDGAEFRNFFGSLDPNVPI